MSLFRFRPADTVNLPKDRESRKAVGALGSSAPRRRSATASTTWPLYLALAALVWQTPGAHAGESRVRFESAGGGPTIAGELKLPAGKKPFPAVVLVHSCLGLPANRAAIMERIAAWGYAALFVDDFGPRGLKETCAVDFPDAVSDAFGALAYLARRSDVDPARIAVVGYSQGGDVALKVAAAPSRPAFGLKNLAFRAAAAFYPPCDNEAAAMLRIPTLILIGASDSVTPAADCRLLAKDQPESVRLIVYKGAGHGFDDPEFGTGSHVLGMTLMFNADAARRAAEALRRFLAENLAR